MKPDVLERDVVHQPAVRTVEERHRGEARRAALAEAAREESEREARVDDVLDEQHVAALERDVEILQEPDAASAAAASVRRELDDVELVVEGQRAREVGEEDGARLERRDEQREHGRRTSAAIAVAELGDAAAISARPR